MPLCKIINKDGISYWHKKPSKCALEGWEVYYFEEYKKAKDSPWGAVLMGSVVSTVDTKVQYNDLLAK